MSTKNKRVAAYLPQDLYEYLETFKSEHDLSESKAIISILAAHFGMAHEVSQEVTHQFVTIEQFKELEKKVAHFSSLLSELSNKQASESSESSSVLQGELLPSNDSLDNTDTSSLAPLNIRELAERFPKIKTYQSVINAKSRHKDNPEGFVAWSRERDKDGIGWRFDSEKKLYFPVP